MTFIIFEKNDHLRRAAKIKTTTIFLAWCVIFAHSIIPHNHVSENFVGCHTILHSISAASDHYDGHQEFENKQEETNLCHLSNLLFQQFNQDNILIATTREDHLYPIIVVGSVPENRNDLFVISPYYGSSSLRAPPSI
jgi:hypothetical protein